MTVDDARVRDFLLPADALRTERVFVNGVPQVEGRDYRVEGHRVRFSSWLRHRSEVGLAGLALTALCASVEAEGDSVDAIVVTPAGRTSVTLRPA